MTLDLEPIQQRQRINRELYNHESEILNDIDALLAEVARLRSRRSVTPEISSVTIGSSSFARASGDLTSLPPVTPPALRDNGKPNREHEYEEDQETTCCVICGWAEACHDFGAPAAGQEPPHEIRHNDSPESAGAMPDVSDAVRDRHRALRGNDLVLSNVPEGGHDEADSASEGRLLPTEVAAHAPSQEPDHESRSPDGDTLGSSSDTLGLPRQRASYEPERLGDAASVNARLVTEAGSEPADSPLVKAWRRISTDEIGVHVLSLELRRQVAATESLLLSRQQALRMASDIYELLAAEAQSAPAPSSAALEQLTVEKDGAYRERDMLVAALSKIWPSHLARHPIEDETWDDDWRWIVCIHSPVGQLTWHIRDRECAWFDHLTVSDGDWDGHSTDEKYARLASLRASSPSGNQE